MNVRILAYLLLVFITTNADLQKAVDHLSALSRVVNTISIEKCLIDDPECIYNVLEELFTPGTKEFFKNLNQFDKDAVVTKISELREWARSLPDVEEAHDYFTKVSRFIEIREVFAFFKDPAKSAFVDNLEKSIEKIISKVNPQGILYPEDIDNFINSMKTIINTNFDSSSNDTVTDPVNTAIGELRGKSKKVEESVSNIGFNGGFFADLKNFHNELRQGIHKEMLNVAAITDDFIIIIINDINTFKSTLTTIKREIANYVTTTRENSKMKDLETNLKTFMEMMNQTGITTTLKDMTIGLPGGVEDLKKMKTDLDEAWLKSLISNGTDITALKTAIDPMHSLTGKLKTMSDKWEKVKNPNEIESVQTLVKDLETAGKASEFTDVASLESSVDTITLCFEKLVEPTTKPKYEEIKEIYDKLDDIDEKLESVREAFTFIDKHNSVKTGALNFIQNVANTVKDAKNYLNKAELLDYQQKIRAMEGNFNSYVTLLELFKTTLESLNDLSFMKDLDFNSLKELKNTFEGNIKTSTESALTCLAQSYFKSEEVKNVVKFSDLVVDFKNNKRDVRSLNNVLSNLKDLKNELESVVKALTKIPTVLGTRRRRSAREILNLPNVKTVSSQLGLGVQALKLLNEVSKINDKVKRIGSAGPQVDQLIASENVVDWTAANKQGLVKLADDMQGLEVKGGEYDEKDILKLKELFEKGSTVTGVTINPHVLYNPISLLLSISSDPQAQSLASDFKDASSLQLNFASHQAQLTAASTTINTIRDYFDRIFGITRPTLPPPPTTAPAPPAAPPAKEKKLIKEEEENEEKRRIRTGGSSRKTRKEPTSTVPIVVLVILGTVSVGLTVFFCYTRCQKEVEKWKREEERERRRRRERRQYAKEGFGSERRRREDAEYEEKKKKKKEKKKEKKEKKEKEKEREEKEKEKKQKKEEDKEEEKEKKKEEDKERMGMNKCF